MLISLSRAAALVCLFTSAALAQNEPGATVKRIMDDPKYKQAMEILSRDHDRLVEENIRLSEVPAPPFKEQAKAQAFLDLLKQAGLADAEIDAEGNVLGLRKGKGGPLLAVVAHLDTVFPAGTNVTVKRDGSKLYGPGIVDDTRGLAVLLAMIRAMNEAKIETDSDILFVATVGEEGLGDLRGVKHLFLKGPYKDKIKTFIALDGSNPAEIMTTALGSRRYRVTFTGPGGHSYRAFGTVNPMFAMGQFLVEFGKMKVPELTTYGVGVVGGGTSVNSIPLEARMEIDMRSAVPAEVAKMESRMKEIALAAADAENNARSTKDGKIAVKMDLIGDRPAGSTAHPLLGERAQPAAQANVARNTQLVSFAWEATMAHGVKPAADTSSTDANIPMSLGIPAITMASGFGGRMHSLEEWLDVDKDVSMRQLGISMATILATAGMQ